MNRWIVRGILVAVLLFAGAMVWLNLRARQPGYLWAQAQLAQQSGNLQRAELLLERLLQRDPHHTDARLLLAHLLVEKARSAEDGSGAESTAQALEHLARAASVARNDASLQRRYLQALLDAERYSEAARVAQQMQQAGQRAPEVYFALAWQAHAQHNFPRAQEMMGELLAAESPPTLRTLNLRATLAESRSDDSELQKAFDGIANLAAHVDVDRPEVAKLSGSLYQRLGEAIRKAPAVEVAELRLLQGLKLLENLSQQRDDAETTRRLGEWAAGWLADFNRTFPAPPLSEIGSVVARQRRQPLEERARALMQRAVEAGSIDSAAFEQLALLDFDRGDIDDGFALLDQGIAVASRHVSTARQEAVNLYRLAVRQLLQQRQTGDLDKYLNVMAGRESTRGEAAFYAGVAAAIEGRPDAAEEHLLAARSGIGDTLPLLAHLADAYWKRGRFRDAAAYLASASSKFDKSTVAERSLLPRNLTSREEVLLALTAAHLANGDFAQATQQLDALSNTVLAPRAQLLMYRQLLHLGRRDEARSFLERARRANSKDVPLALAEFRAAVDEGDFARAEYLIQNLIAKEPTSRTVRLALAEWRAAQRRSSDAIATLEQLRAETKSPQVDVALSMIGLANEQYDEVRRRIERLHRDPETRVRACEVGALLGLRRHELHETEWLLASQKRATESDPHTHFWQMALAEARDDEEEGLDRLGAALGVPKVLGLVPLRLLHALAMLAELESTRAAADRVAGMLRDDPHEPALLLSKADLEVKLGQYEEAEKTLTQLDRRMPNLGSSPYLRAKIAEARGASSMVPAQLRRALLFEPRHRAARLWLIDLHRAAGEDEAALEQTLAGLEADPQAWELYFIQADLLEELRRNDEVVPTLESAVAQFPNRPHLYRRLSEAQLDAGRLAEARRALQRAIELGLSANEAESLQQRLDALTQREDDSS